MTSAGAPSSHAPSSGSRPNPIRRFFGILGPGLITGASDDDPSGIGTYASVGAAHGYSVLWTSLVTLPLQSGVQYVCAKVGQVTGRGLAGVLRQHYPRPILYLAVAGLFVANTINVGADIGAIGAAVNLLVPIPAIVIVPIAAASILLLLVFGSYKLIERTFRWLALALLAFVGSAILAHPDIGQLVRGSFIPTIELKPAFIQALVAILGTTISPYLFFWEAGEEVEEEKAEGKRTLRSRQGTTDRKLNERKIDVFVGMAFSNAVMYFVFLATAATLFQAGKTDINSATDAAQALRPLAGDAAAVLLAAGLIGGGFLAVPVLAGSAAYALAESFSWRHGLDEKPHRAKQFYIALAVATLVGMAINFLGINPFDALFATAVINGLLAPPLLLLILLIANNRAIMGDRTNDLRSNVLVGATCLVMAVAGTVMIVGTIAGWT